MLSEKEMEGIVQKVGIEIYPYFTLILVSEKMELLLKDRKEASGTKKKYFLFSCISFLFFLFFGASAVFNPENVGGEIISFVFLMFSSIIESISFSTLMTIDNTLEYLDKIRKVYTNNGGV